LTHKNLPNKYVISDTIKLNRRAAIHPCTAKPGTIFAARNTIRILMTRRNNPRVIIVTGIVSAISIGFKNVFRRAKTNATSMAVLASETTTPGTSFAAI